MRPKKLYNPYRKRTMAKNGHMLKMLGIYLGGLCKGMLIGMLLGKKLKK